MLNTDTDPVALKDALVARARELAPRFRQRAAAAESAGKLPAESVEEMLEAGFARILSPPRFGGYGLGLETSFDVVLEIGKGDTSHAWCGALMMEIPHYVASCHEEAQEAVWADGPDVPLAASILPYCTVTPVEGGYRISGRSPFASGVNHAAWSFVAGMIPSDGPPDWAMFLVPRDEYDIEVSWDVAGMRATGSNTVVTDNVFVPGTRVLRFANIREGQTAAGEAAPGPLGGSPQVSWAALTFVLPMLGAAQGAYQEFVAHTVNRKTPNGDRLAETPQMQAVIGRVAATLDSAELLLRRIAGTAQTAESSSLELRARAMRDYARATELTIDAIDLLVANSGTTAFGSANPLQRAWRDIHFAASHVSLNPLANNAHWGRIALGIPRPAQQPFF